MSFVPSILLAADPAPHGDATTWIAIAVGLLIFAYVVLRPRSKRDPLERVSSIPSTTTSLAQQRAVERQMSTLLVELSEMSRTIGAGLDTRAAKLQVLIEDADHRIAILQQLQSATGQNTGQNVRTSLNERSALLAPIVDEGRAPDSETDNANGEISAALPINSPAVVPAIAPPNVFPIDPQDAQIYQLSDEGRSVGEISAMLSRPFGEVDLILRVRPTTRSMTA